MHCAPQGRQPKGQGGHRGKKQSKGQHGPVRTQTGFNARPGGQQTGGGDRKEPAKDGSRTDQHQAFHQQLAKERDTARTDGETETEFAGTRCVARLQHENHIGAGD